MSDWSKMLIERVLQENLPLLLDADALNLLSMMSITRDNWVLTPHPGEAARLLHADRNDIQQHRLVSAKQLALKYGGVVVLKGAKTCISDGSQCEISLLGNPGMATAGLGDILSGVIGGLMAQGLTAWQAATLGVLLHGMAGDLAAENGMRGMVATDLLPYLRQLVNQVE
jgi:NAD(P)H-hydrate epimerase